jgi:beta-glucanase (GH16 family)
VSKTGSLIHLFTFVCGTFCLTTTSPLDAQPPVRSGYTIEWFDEFDGTSLNTNLWTASNTNVTTNNSLQDYLPGQISVGDGYMTILTESVPSRGRAYRSGLIESKSLQKYGRWDIRARLPTSQGMWPAIWLLANAPWPSQGEIDIMENRGTQPNLTSSAFHYGINGGGQFEHNFVSSEQTSVHDDTPQDYHNDFHTYSVEWDPDQVRFFVDDVHHWTVRDDDVGGFLTNNVGPMRLIINTAVGGGFLQDPEPGSTIYQEFEVDYVHVYSKSAVDKVMTFDNGDFESNGGSLAYWTKFGNSLNNVSSGNQQIADGAEALKLFGQFNGETNYSGIEQGISVSAGDDLTASADAFVASEDSIFGSGNNVFFKIDYYNKQHGLFGSSEYISSDSILLANGSTSNDQWLTKELTSVAPPGAVEARLAIVFEQKDNAGGAVFVDNVEFGQNLIPGDFDQDGDVDTNDINFFAGNLGQGASFNPQMDLNNDGTITLVDHDLHVNTLVQENGRTGALIGDLNFDGTVNVLGDAFTLVGNLGRTGVGYAGGDLNADGQVNVLGDAFRLIGNLGQSLP